MANHNHNHNHNHGHGHGPEDMILGALRVNIKRGINLAARDVSTSDPYVVVSLAHQKVMTSAIRSNLSPEWNEDLTLHVPDEHELLKIEVYDNDIVYDDKMGDAEVNITPFMEAVRAKKGSMPDETVICKVRPGRENCLVEDSYVICMNDKVTQNMFLRLRNVECGEIELQLQWIDNPSIHRRH